MVWYVLSGWLAEVSVRAMFFYLNKRKSFTWLNILRHIHLTWTVRWSDGVMGYE